MYASFILVRYLLTPSIFGKSVLVAICILHRVMRIREVLTRLLVSQRLIESILVLGGEDHVVPLLDWWQVEFVGVDLLAELHPQVPRAAHILLHRPLASLLVVDELGQKRRLVLGLLLLLLETCLAPA
mmetsp:Transcript_45309/g.33086  ORF Transcript_45309/g.33086 Transcript_45309/m.33086 type:complete len:128 (+) Transcript_45309:502-885(+)